MILLFLLSFVACCYAMSRSHVRCAHMRDTFQTDKPPFDGESISCIFAASYDPNLVELSETAKALNATLYATSIEYQKCQLKLVACRMCEHVISARLKICDMVPQGAEGPEFCKHIVQDHETCRHQRDCPEKCYESWPPRVELVINV
jgi:hypothetical protein